MTNISNAVDLLEIENEYYSLIIKGKPVHPDIDYLYSDKDRKGIKAVLEVIHTSMPEIAFHIMILRMD